MGQEESPRTHGTTSSVSNAHELSMGRGIPGHHDDISSDFALEARLATAAGRVGDLLTNQRYLMVA